jgi:hypothetical protein
MYHVLERRERERERKRQDDDDDDVIFYIINNS